MRRISYISAALCLAAVVWFLLQPPPVAVDVAPVTRGSMQVTVNHDGRTRIRERYVVSSPLAGRLLRIDLDPGDPIVAGKTQVALIEPTDPELLNPRAVAEAQARTQAAQAKLDMAAPQLKRARENLNFAETELGRIRQLAQKGGTTPQQVDEKQLAFDVATTEFNEAQFGREIAEFELQQAKAALIRTGRSTTEDAPSATSGDDWQFRILSPITGQVLRVFRDSATVVTPGEQLLELGDPSDLEVEVDVLSTDAVQIRPGASVFLEEWGGDSALPGKVRLVEPSAFTKISALGVEEQRVNVIIDFVGDAAGNSGLGDGYRVEARIVVWQSADAIMVPAGALFRTNEKWSVFRVVDGTAALTTVSLGRMNDQHAEVLEGLADGDIVVMHPGDQLSDGTIVEER